MLASYSDGVAAGSLHMSGMAIDIRVPGLVVAVPVHRVALTMAEGGVGYYPRSDFRPRRYRQGPPLGPSPAAS